MPKKLCCAISRKVSVKLFWFLLIFVCIDALYCYAVFVLLYRSSVIKKIVPLKKRRVKGAVFINFRAEHDTGCARDTQLKLKEHRKQTIYFGYQLV